MAQHDPMATLSCKRELADLDQKYEEARRRLIEADGERDADPKTVHTVLRELIALRRQMLEYESAEVERITAKYRPAHVAS